jgi:uncharacterized protein (DUF2252 family)
MEDEIETDGREAPVRPIKPARPRKTERDLFGGKRLSAEERRAAGKALRDKVPRESHGEWKERPDRPDPIEILIASDKGRIPELVPIRHGRMLTSPFAYLRGAAAGMAADLSTTPISGMRVQACGDCHLMNFGAFATPERNLIFDINDFDETLPAPWEWDLKRLAASLVAAGRCIGLKERDSLAAVLSAAHSYRRWMAQYAEMRAMEVWYDRIDINRVMDEIPAAAQKRLRARVEKARGQSVAEHEFPKLVESKGARPRIKDNPPLIFHEQGSERKEFRGNVMNAFKMYRKTLPDHYRVLLDRFQINDLAIKVVGVGSVGTFCAVVLFMAAENEPLFLQVKQANASVLEPYAGKSVYSNHGQRVVMGQRLMQAASDMMLGWTEGKLRGRHFYVRQLRDMKLSAIMEAMEPETLRAYAKLCGWTLARAHARSGDAAMISGYLGNSGVFDEAVAKFAAAYADQTESDHKALRKAVRDGRLEAVTA